MENFEKIQKALSLIREVKESTKDNDLLQMFIQESETRLENVILWLKGKS